MPVLGMLSARQTRTQGLPWKAQEGNPVLGQRDGHFETHRHRQVQTYDELTWKRSTAAW